VGFWPNNIVQRGKMVVVTFTATSNSSKLSASCKTTLRVLAVDTPIVCNTADSLCKLKPAALGKPYSTAYDLVIQGVNAADEVAYRAGGAIFEQGMSTEVTKDILSPNNKVGLRLLGIPTQSGTYRFAVNATSGDATTTANGGPFVIEVLDCLDEYESCGNNGTCKDGVDNSDGHVDCSCMGGFLPGDDGRCSKPAVPLLVTCPCDLQLAKVGDEDLIDAPPQFWESIYNDAVSGGSGGDPNIIIRRSDGQPVADKAGGAHKPFTAGDVTVITLEATSGDGQQSKKCQVSVGVVHVNSTIYNDIRRMTRDEIPSDNPVSLEMDPTGVISGYDVSYTLNSSSLTTSQVEGI